MDCYCYPKHVALPSIAFDTPKYSQHDGDEKDREEANENKWHENTESGKWNDNGGWENNQDWDEEWSEWDNTKVKDFGHFDSTDSGSGVSGNSDEIARLEQEMNAVNKQLDGIKNEDRNNHVD